MEHRRLLPYVKNETLNEVIIRLQEREYEYLAYITEKIRRDNICLMPEFVIETGIALPLSFGVYELLDLSLSKGERLPSVGMDILLEKSGQPLIAIVDESNNFEELTFREIIEDGNYNIKEFMDWADPEKQKIPFRHIGLVIYSSLRAQSEKDKIRRIRELN